MSLPYEVLGEVTGSIKSGSYLSEQDTTLFFASEGKDVWFGLSPNDVVEFSVYNTDDNTQLQWASLHQDKTYKTTTLTYIDSLNIPHSYSFRELVNDFNIYKSSKILLSPIDDLTSVGVTSGSFKVSYNFTRELAGNPTNTLTIKEISPSRKEIKLLPLGQADITYTSFCLKKFPTRDVTPVLISVVQNLPYDQTFRLMSSLTQYKSSIAFLSSIFFLQDDASVTRFLKNLYEDFVKYTFLSEDQINAGLEPTRISRIQGIRSYYNNYLLQNLDTISDFDAIEQQFINFVNLRLDQAFSQFSNQTGDDYQNARKFCYDFFVTYFYDLVVRPLQKAHQNKYFGFLKNVLNFGNNNYFQILTHDFLDERQSPNDPLTLIVKLSSELPSNYSVKSNCWVSNFGMSPYVATVILRNPVIFQTVKISAPNFGPPTQFITKENVNKLYSSDDLVLDSNVQDSININKSLVKLNTDYTDFSNFIVFSSAAGRIGIFKNKMIEWTTLSGSLVELTRRYNQSLSSSIVYPYFLSEQTVLQNQLSDLVQSFDGYESFLFNSGDYTYSLPSASFVDKAAVEDNDIAAQTYDKNNSDSLVNNTPDYIINTGGNEDYLTFLAMSGHHFDNIYTYISALPIERQVKNELSSSIPTNTLKEMLVSFGWNVDDIVNNLNVDEVYLNSLNGATYDALSAEQRLQTIWNRLLVTLPGLYKTKGTEECVKLLMSAYGLPTSLISIREYGGVDVSDTPQPTYKLDEKTYMLHFSGSNDYIEGPMPFTTKTVEFKFAVEKPETYVDYSVVPLFTSIPYPNTDTGSAAWTVGLYKVPGQFTGKLVFQMGSGSTGAKITSSALPLLNGDIFSVMIRRNNTNANFEFNENDNSAPLDYDLVVQRNEDGRRIFYSTSSMNLYVQDNETFAQFGRFRLGGEFRGTLDKLSIWDVPIDDTDFEEHVDDINSYGYSGSVAYKNLFVRLSWDYPQSVFFDLGGFSSVWIDNRSSYYALPNYYTDPENLSSSIDPTLFTASATIISERWSSVVPTGSIVIVANNFQEILDSNFTSSFNTSSCKFESSSIYPFNFRELTYQQDIDASKYGPNKYKNKKIRRLDYSVEARFDSNDRSTIVTDETISGESNQLGFFIDPQDSKNKDIIRYVGRAGIMQLIADPSNLYSQRYEDLVAKNYEYNAAGDKKTLFNELLTVYKFYFDKSIFEAIKNILPARANSFTGVVIEPTILERPKYQNRPITSSATVTDKTPAEITNIVSVSTDLLWSSLSGLSQSLDLTYLGDPIQMRDKNLFGGYITDIMDNVQVVTYGDYEGLIRGWDSANSGNLWIYGSVSRERPTDLAQIGPHHTLYEPQFDGAINQGSHQILYYMLKVWDKFYYYAKTGDYKRTDNPLDDTYASASVYLYKYIMVDERFMKRLVYFFDLTSGSDASYTFMLGNYYHRINTFRNTPDQTVSNVYAFNINPINPVDFQLAVSPVAQYFEISKGYPRNHYTHKMTQFSKTMYPKFIASDTSSIYVKGRQTIDTTINNGGINDGTFPVQSFRVSNVNVMNATNIIQTVPSTTTGQTSVNTNTVVTPSQPTVLTTVKAKNTKNKSKNLLLNFHKTIFKKIFG